jgi:hypothetical protein
VRETERESEKAFALAEEPEKSREVERALDTFHALISMHINHSKTWVQDIRECHQHNQEMMSFEVGKKLNMPH